jgi:hypothetical protein
MNKIPEDTNFEVTWGYNQKRNFDTLGEAVLFCERNNIVSFSVKQGTVDYTSSVHNNLCYRRSMRITDEERKND